MLYFYFQHSVDVNIFYYCLPNVLKERRFKAFFRILSAILVGLCVKKIASADRIVIMNKGFVQQIGAPKDVYNDSRNVFVAMFIGNPPMNVKEVAVDGSVPVNGGERIALPQNVMPAYAEFLKNRPAYFTELDSLCDTSFEHQLAAKLREFSRTYGQKVRPRRARYACKRA